MANHFTQDLPLQAKWQCMIDERKPGLSIPWSMAARHTARSGFKLGKICYTFKFRRESI